MAESKPSAALLSHGSDAFYAHLASVLRDAGAHAPQMQVRFEHLSLYADVVMAQDQKAELPTLVNTLTTGVRGVWQRQRVARKTILSDLSGVLRPGSMTLVLAQPGSGKSALLQALAGRFYMAKNVSRDGDVRYNGTPQAEMKARLPQIAALVGQRDHHFAKLTLGETLAFAAQCGGACLPFNTEALCAEGNEEAKQEATTLGQVLEEHGTQVVIDQFGLGNCQHTVVGDAMLRGVSGGERKRLTTSEMMFGNKNVLFLDEITTGLDSAAAYDIVKMYRSQAKHLHKTVVMALLQPSPEIFELFDDVLMLNKGHMMYHGPRDQALEYFEELGFHCPPHRDVADFLMDLGTHQQHQYEVDRADGKAIPFKPTEFAQSFELSPLHLATVQVLETPVDAALLEDNARYFDHIPSFRQSFVQSTLALLSRQMKITLRNRALLRSRVIMVVLMGFLFSTSFGHVDLKNVQMVMGLLFMCIMFLAFGQAAHIPTYIGGRAVFYKQRDANFYRTLSYTLACSFAQIPWCFVEAVVFGSIVYWACGFVRTISAFVIFELCILMMVISMGLFFFFLSTFIPNLHVAKPMAMVTVLFYNLFAGFIISRGQIPDYFIWIYWIDPLAWGLRAVAVSQYRDSRFDVDTYDNIPYFKQYGKQMGVYSLGLFDVQSEKTWVWAAFVFIIALYVFYVTLSTLILEHKRFDTSIHNSADSGNDEELRDEYSSTTSDNSSVAYAIAVTPRTADCTDIKVSVLPSERVHTVVPVTLAWKNLRYSVRDPQNPKESLELLKGVSGFALPGKLTALMGSTGAGKTTLMDVIAGRKTEGTIIGNILLNGHQATPLAIQRSTGYCEQMDIHSNGSTIREALTFSAFLRQSSDISDEQKFDSVEECLDLLNLRPIADQIIRGSSVEQMKRLTIGVEVAAQPSVLFLDEPTSGLDAHSAKIIMDGVRKVADTGRTVVCTIHQPSWKVFQVFDSLLLLKMGGQTVYFGDLGKKSSELIKYFEAIPSTRPIETRANPATWMLEVIGAGVGNTQGQDTDFVGAFNASEKSRDMLAMLNQEGVGCESLGVPALVFDGKRAATEVTQMKFVVKRFFSLYWRTPAYNLTRLAIDVVVALLFGLAFRGADFTTYQGINAGAAMVALTTIFLGMISFNSVLPIAMEDRAAFYRERASQTYNALWYFVGSTLAEIPYVAVGTLLFLLVFFPMVGFSGVTRFLLYWAGLVVHVLMQTYLGLLLVWAMPSIDVAVLIGVMLNMIFMVFMGFNPPASMIPKAYHWLHAVCPPRYSLALMGAILFADCPDPSSSYLACQPMKNLPPTVAQEITVKGFVEDIYQIRHDDIGRNFAILAGFAIVFRLLGLLALRFINHQKK